MRIPRSDHLIDLFLHLVDAALDVGIVVYLYHEVAFGLVGRDGKLGERILEVLIPCAAATAGSVGVDHEVALGIVAACGAHDIDKALCIAVDGLIGRCCNSSIILVLRRKRGEAPATELVEHLVVTLEEQMLVVVLELGGNLLLVL